MKKVEKSYIDIDGERWPVKIYREPRSSYRASVGKESLILRLPSRRFLSDEQPAWSWFKAWVEKLVRQNSVALQHLRVRFFQHGDEIKVGSRSYLLRLFLEPRQSHVAKLQTDGSILIKLADHTAPKDNQRAIKLLLGKVIGRDFLPGVTQRVNEINTAHFKMPIKGVKLKQNFSNWGSCSRHGNINLSTRLLFAPQPVIDYVIIHELAHLLEFNHSDRFWEIVGKVMPDYEKKERWLKDNFHACDFNPVTKD